MNTVCLIGNLTRDPEVRYTQAGMPITSFGIAFNGRRKEGDQWVDHPHFFDVKAWGERFERLAEHLAKGSKVGITGTLEQERWEKDGQNRSKVVINARDITFAGSKVEGDGSSSTRAPADNDVPDSQFMPVGGASSDDDDIPF